MDTLKGEKDLRANQKVLGIGLGLSHDPLKDLRANQRVLGIGLGLSHDPLKDLRANQRVLGIGLSHDPLKDLRANQKVLGIGLGSAALNSRLVGVKINNLADSGALAHLEKNLHKTIKQVFSSKLLNKGDQSVVGNNTLLGFQSKLIKSVELGISKEFLKNLNKLSNFTLNDIDISKDGYLSISDSQIVQKIESLNEEFNENPTGIWTKLNAWAINILEYPTRLKEKQPFILLIVNIMIVLWTFVVIPALEDLIKDKVLNTFQLSKESPNKNVRDIKGSLSNEFIDAKRYINKVRITNRETPVFHSNKRKSGKIDSIHRNKPVIILTKKRKWCFVIYNNEQQEEVTGWVYTGNLAK